MDIVKQAGTRPRWRDRRFIAGAVLLLAVPLGAVYGLGNPGPAVDADALWLGQVEHGVMNREVRANGVLVARDIRWIVAGTSATVQQVVVQPGADVQADTLIAQLINPDLDVALRTAEAGLAAAQAELQATTASLQTQLLDKQAESVLLEGEWKVAQMRAQAYKRAFDGGAMAGIDMRQSQIAEEQAGKRHQIQLRRQASFSADIAAQRAAAVARRDQARAAADVARSQLAALQVRAGFDGVLQQVDVEPGQQVEVGTKLARVARPDDLLARLQVAEVLAKDVRLQQPVTVDTRNGRVDGRVTRIDPAVRDGTVTVDVELVQALPEGARPDLAVDGRILLDTLPAATHMPRPGLAAAEGKGSVFVLTADKQHARRVAVRYGAASSDRIQVISGLKAGDTVVLSDTSRWAEHDQLRLD